MVTSKAGKDVVAERFFAFGSIIYSAAQVLALV
jgi:hypothetical protein